MLHPRVLRRLPCQRAPAQAPGYTMPLAVGAAGLLLLQSLTVQSITQLERLQVNAMERLSREDDLLSSAAHQLLASLNGSRGCLLALPLESWEGDGADCASAEDLVNLRRLVVWQVPVRLISWRPSIDGASAQFELQLEAANDRTPRRGRFGVRLTGVPPQAVDPRPHTMGGPGP
ncbi:MAG: hypothetical protein VKP70_12095 [Cyanobacteriota bacterium]|nr:hypothetical protein [Cyanobacteriota bacterium]